MRTAVKPLGGSGVKNSGIPKVQQAPVQIVEKEQPLDIDVLRTQLEIAKIEEDKATKAANQYVTDNMGWLEMKDPSELQSLNDTAAAAKQNREALQAQLEAAEYAEKYSQKTYKDNFFGQTGASYTLGRINQDSALAWNDYLKNPTAENRAKASRIDATLQQFWSNNAQTLDEDAALPWISQSVASQIPQTLGQLKYGAVGAAGGAAVGSAIPVVGTITGAKLGYTAGSTKYAYDTMRGAAFRNLLAHGVDEETAKAAAGNEAVLNSVIEAGDTGVDIVTLGGGKVIKSVLGYGANILTEGVQEGTQEIIGTANLRRAQEGQTGLWGLAKDSLKLGWDALTGKDPEAAEQAKASLKEGMKVAAVLNGAAHLTTMPFALTSSPVFSSVPPLTANEISAMQKQLADTQHKKKLDDLAVVYEENVENVENVSDFADGNTYADWLHSIGAEATPLNTLEKYNEAKYNYSPEYQLLSGYSRAVEKGDISPLVGFVEYEQTDKVLQESVVGLKIAPDIEIESFTTHFIDRVIGQTSTAHSNMRCGVEIADAMDALQNPLKIGPKRNMPDGDVRQTLYGTKAVVTVSIRDRRIIQTNP